MEDTSLTLTDEATTRHRRIEFHLARKPFSLTGINNNGDFRLETLNPSAVNGTNLNKAVANRDSLKPDGSSSKALENGLDPELVFGMTFRRIGAGLENLGNTCFLNSVLQCLTYTEPLAAYLQSGKHQVSCRVAGFCALCAIQKHVSRALQSTGRILVPKDLVSNLRCISRNFRNARQEDAHEYMVNLLESMHKCCLPKGVPSESPSAYERSLVHKIFGGRLRSQVRCLQCNYCSDTYDPFLDLSLEIAKADSLIKALGNFTAREQLDGGAKHYQCQHCRQKVKALKQLSVYKAPYVLTIHLKRFHAHDPGRKIDKRVQFGSTLNLKPFFSGSHEGDLTYTLYGVLVHSGWSTHSGHYYCFVRTSGGTWYSVDDNRINPVGEKTVLEQKAYMLFYYRDLKNVAPKKPVQVAQKENMGELKKEMLSTPQKEIKGSVPDSSIQKVFSGVNTSALAFMKNPVKESSTLSSAMPLVNGTGHYTNSGRASLSSTAVKIYNKNEEGSSSKDVNLSANVQSICEPNHPAIEGVVADVTFKKINFLSDEGVSGVPQSKGDDKTTGKTDIVVASQARSIPNGSTFGVLPNGKVSSSGMKSVHGQIDPSSTPIMLTKSLGMLAPDQKSQRKVKKKVLKRWPMNLHLGSNILHGASLSLRKKKKRKHDKMQSSRVDNLTKENMEEIDLGPSTYKKTSRKRDRSCLKDVQSGSANNTVVLNSAGDSPINVINGEFKERLDEHGTVPATEKSLNESLRSNPFLSVSQCDTREPDVTKDVQTKSQQDCIVSMGSRALLETIVAPWDGVELPQSREVESSTRETASIGYVLDEWGNEYDKGKVKKIRTSKEDFGGPNPFQEIASKKAHLKKTRFEKAKMGRQRSFRNKPFRVGR